MTETVEQIMNKILIDSNYINIDKLTNGYLINLGLTQDKINLLIDFYSDEYDYYKINFLDLIDLLDILSKLECENIERLLIILKHGYYNESKNYIMNNSFHHLEHLFDQITRDPISYSIINNNSKLFAFLSERKMLQYVKLISGNGNLDMVKYIFSYSPCTNLDDQIYTAFLKNKFDIVEYLIENLDVPNLYNLLLFAVHKQDFKFVEYIILLDCPQEEIYNVGDEKILSIAERLGDRDIVRILSENNFFDDSDY